MSTGPVLAFVLSDEEGSQTFALKVLQGEISVTHRGQGHLHGLVAICARTIDFVELRPPVPSHWWQLQSVTSMHC